MTVLVLVPALVGFAYLAVRWWRLAIVLLVFLLPTYLLRTMVFGVPTNLFELLVLVAIVVGVLQPVVRRLWWERWRHMSRVVRVFVLAFVAAALISAVVSVELRVSLGILKGWVVVPLVLGFMVYCIAGGRRNFHIINAVVFSGLVMALLGLSQVGALERIRGVYDVPNSLALWLAPIITLAVWQAWQHVARSRQQARLYGLVAIFMLAALLATQSVAGLSSVALSLGFGLLLFRRKFSRRFLLMGTGAWLGLVIFGLGLLLVSGRLSYLAAPVVDPSIHNSVSVRLQLWQAGWQLISERPLLGVGLGQFEPQYQVLLARWSAEGRAIIPEFVFRDPHNWILAFWLNTGLLGLLSFAGVHVIVLKRAFQKIAPPTGGRNGKPDIRKQELEKQAVVLALVTLLLFGLVDTIYWKNDLAALHWILLALLLA